MPKEYRIPVTFTSSDPYSGDLSVYPTANFSAQYHGFEIHTAEGPINSNTPFEDQGLLHSGRRTLDLSGFKLNEEYSIGVLAISNDGNRPILAEHTFTSTPFEEGKKFHTFPLTFPSF